MNPAPIGERPQSVASRRRGTWANRVLAWGASIPFPVVLAPAAVADQDLVAAKTASRWPMSVP